jgi:hypothetical protein
VCEDALVRLDWKVLELCFGDKDVAVAICDDATA